MEIKWKLKSESLNSNKEKAFTFLLYRKKRRILLCNKVRFLIT